MSCKEDMYNNLILLPKLFDDTPYIQPMIILQRECETSFCDLNKMSSRKFSYQHIDVSYPMQKVGKYEFPVIEPYNDEIPSILTPYYRHRKGDTSGAVHFFIDDFRYSCMHVWDNLQQYTKNVSRYHTIIAPDYSLYLDQSKALNIFQLYQNRVITAYWQQLGLKVIPTVTWENAESFDYCFDALPQKSILAIGGLGTRCSKNLTILWEYGVRLTITTLHPTILLLYGAPRMLDLPVKTIYITDYIHEKFSKIK